MRRIRVGDVVRVKGLAFLAVIVTLTAPRHDRHYATLSYVDDEGEEVCFGPVPVRDCRLA